MPRWFRRRKKEEEAPPESSPGEVSAALESESPAAAVTEAPVAEIPEAANPTATPPDASAPAEPEEVEEAEPRKGLFSRFRRQKKEAEPSPESLESPLNEAAAAAAAEPEAAPEAALETETPEAASPLAEEALETTPEEEAEPRKGLFRRFRERLSRSREALAGGLDRVFAGRKEVDAALLEELEELLITADLGVETTLHLVQALQERLKRRELADVGRLKAALREEMLSLLQGPPAPPRTTKPWVVLLVGVNGVGKTTTLAKLAHQEQLQGRAPLLIAGDTFRAAAVEQLQIWGERLGAPVIHQKTGADPAAVVFDGLAAALARDVDTVFIDTAGRLHTKVNLMEELKKIFRTAGKKLPGAPHEVLLVLDATTGQNALSQARIFHEAVGISGIVLTKMDGTAKGGVALAVTHETGLPLRYIGLGEGMEDLRPFDAEAFVAAILGEDEAG